jgi:serine/threonine protein kinase
MAHDAAPGGDEDGIEIGEQIGDFRVVGKLAGGWYRALEFSVTRRAMLHVAGEHTYIDPEAVAGLEHPGVARVIAHGTTVDRRPWIACEVVNGIALHGLISQQIMPPNEVLHVIRCVAEVLAAAHRVGVVHRALTPRSITLVTNGIDFPVSIGDWGLRYHRRNAFSAPEENGDGRADVYALGVIAHRALLGTLPGNGALAIPGAPAGLATLLHSMLATDPNMRLTALEVRALATEVMATASSDAVATALEAALLASTDPGDLVSFADDDLTQAPTPRFSRPKWTPPPGSYPPGVTPPPPTDEHKSK